MSPSATFLRFWQTDLTRECFISHTTSQDRQALRLVCRDFAYDFAPFLFSDLIINVDTHTFGRQARMNALHRVGHHCKAVTFSMPHTEEAFLPPLLDPTTGAEEDFDYRPEIENARQTDPRLSMTKFGSWETNDLLVVQYPPIFHAATNVSAFIHAFSSLKNITCFTISCPDQSSEQRYRRSAVDYALISLRMALEQVCPQNLTTLILNPIHASAPQYLRPFTSFGSCPRSSRLWSKIKNLTITIDCHGSTSHTRADHYKILHTYLSIFSSLQNLDFTWLGSPGPMPLTLHSEPCCLASYVEPITPLASSSSSPNYVTPPENPEADSYFSITPEQDGVPTLFRQITQNALRFRNLRTFNLRNANISFPDQIAGFITKHRRSLTDFSFNETKLLSGTWDDALSPLTRLGTLERRKHPGIKDQLLNRDSLSGLGSQQRLSRPQSYERKRASVKVVDFNLDEFLEDIPAGPPPLDPFPDLPSPSISSRTSSLLPPLLPALRYTPKRGTRQNSSLNLNTISNDAESAMEVPIMLSETPSPVSPMLQTEDETWSPLSSISTNTSVSTDDSLTTSPTRKPTRNRLTKPLPKTPPPIRAEPCIISQTQEDLEKLRMFSLEFEMEQQMKLQQQQKSETSTATRTHAERRTMPMDSSRRHSHTQVRSQGPDLNHATSQNSMPRHKLHRNPSSTSTTTTSTLASNSSSAAKSAVSANAGLEAAAVLKEEFIIQGRLWDDSTTPGGGGPLPQMYCHPGYGMGYYGAAAGAGIATWSYPASHAHGLPQSQPCFGEVHPTCHGTDCPYPYPQAYACPYSNGHPFPFMPRRPLPHAAQPKSKLASLAKRAKHVLFSSSSDTSPQSSRPRNHKNDLGYHYYSVSGCGGSHGISNVGTGRSAPFSTDRWDSTWDGITVVHDEGDEV